MFVLNWATFAAVAEVVDGGGRTMGLVGGGCARVGWADELRTGKSSPGEEKQAPMSRVMRKIKMATGGTGVEACCHVITPTLAPPKIILRSPLGIQEAGL